MTDSIEMQKACENADRAEEMAALRMHSRELGLGVGSGIGYGHLGVTAKSSEAQDRERALQIAWDLYRDKGDHILVLKAAHEITQFLSGKMTYEPPKPEPIHDDP